MASKRQTTMAKIARERDARERRARKQEKRDQKRDARLAKANPETAETVVDAQSSEPEAAPIP
jgi:hypothetical protein